MTLQLRSVFARLHRHAAASLAACGYTSDNARHLFEHSRVIIFALILQNVNTDIEAKYYTVASHTYI